MSPSPLVLQPHWSSPRQARIGSLLGKHGVIIQSIRDSTGARLKLADPIPGTDERVIIISARSDKNFRSGDSATGGDAAVDRPDDWSVAQEALIRVHARIADADGDNREFRDKDGAEGGASNGGANSGGTPARLLVPSSQIGCLLGKGGSIIAGMRQDSGAHIRIFNKDKLPPCALPTDELVQVRRLRGAYIVELVQVRGLRGAYIVELVQVRGLRGAYIVELVQVRGLRGAYIVELVQVRGLRGAYIVELVQVRGLRGAYIVELAQVTGEYPVVQKALELISIRLRRSPPRDPPNFIAMHPTSGYHQPAGYQPSPGYQASGYHRGADSYPSRSAPAAAFPPQGYSPQGYSPYAPPQVYALASSPFGGAWGAGAPAGAAHGYGGMGGGGRGGGGAGAGEGAPVEMELRVLCPADRVGIVIGKGGSRIKQIKEETGARVKVTEAVADCDERIVIIDAMEAPFSGHSPTEEALFRVHAAISQHHAGDRAAGAGDEGGRDSHVTARLLVRKGQVGCVMGKGGSIISELRSTSRARINIPPRDQLPKCADESDEVLVVSGEPHCVSHALRLICARIRGRETAVASKGAAAADARGAAAGGARGFSSAAGAAAGGYAESGRGGAYGYPGSNSRGDGAYGCSPAGAAAGAPPAIVATLSAAGPDGTVGWSYEVRCTAVGCGGLRCEAVHCCCGEPKVEPSYHDSGYSAPRGSGWDVAPAAAQDYANYSHASAPAPAHFSSPPPTHTPAAASAGGTAAGGGGSAGAGGGGSGAGGGVMTALVTVPAVAAGAVIGKGGANIQQIKSVRGGKGAQWGVGNDGAGASGLLTRPVIGYWRVYEGREAENQQDVLHCYQPLAPLAPSPRPRTFPPMQISGARVRMYEGQEGENERVVEVVGSADQVQAAQAIIHAFVIKGTAAAERHAERREAY
ncbi:unnamed protein product [Closterium sp. Naga37s-1]|nr:unnamed protein product [Closterium sp. Naga37s-1]